MTDSSRILNESDLTEIAASIQEKQPDIVPYSLMCELSMRFLAHAIPEKRSQILAGDFSQVHQTFALEMLRLNDKPSTMWLDEDRQVAAYGGIEPLLFGKLPDGIIEHYARLIGVTENPPLLDPVLAEIEQDLAN